jgi:hypothetical protein
MSLQTFGSLLFTVTVYVNFFQLLTKVAGIPERRLLESIRLSLDTGNKTSGLWRGASATIVSVAGIQNKQYLKSVALGHIYDL